MHSCNLVRKTWYWENIGLVTRIMSIYNFRYYNKSNALTFILIEITNNTTNFIIYHHNFIDNKYNVIADK